jgi:hypothetical protein
MMMMFISALLGLACLQVQLPELSARALDDYVNKADEGWGFTDFGPDHVISGHNLDKTRSWTGYTLNYTSQFWLTDADFAESSEAKSLWWHYLVSIICCFPLSSFNY